MPCRVLIVDDDPLVRETLGLIFEDLGWRVRNASSGSEARSVLLGGQKFDLLLTDIRMPGELNGWALAEEVRRGHPDLPIIYCSGYSTEPVRLVERSAYVPKPFRAEAILMALQDFGLPGSAEEGLRISPADRETAAETIHGFLKQSAYTPAETERLKRAYDRIILKLGREIPLGLREAVAAEVMATAAKMQRIDEADIVRRVRAVLDL